MSDWVPVTALVIVVSGVSLPFELFNSNVPEDERRLVV